MNEDKALEAIRKLTHDDEPAFPVLMQRIADMAMDFRDQYNLLSMKNRGALLQSLLDNGIRIVADDEGLYGIRGDGLYSARTGIRVAKARDISLEQDREGTFLVDDTSGHRYKVVHRY